MRPYMPRGRMTEDPVDGQYPSRKTIFVGNKRRSALKRKMRSHKKSARRFVSETD